jgi:hypothetical protein
MIKNDLHQVYIYGLLDCVKTVIKHDLYQVYIFGLLDCVLSTAGLLFA